MIKNRKININKIMAWIILAFALFDTARNYTILPIAFGYIKDICIYGLFILNLKKLKFPHYLGVGFIIWMCIVMLFSPIGILTSTYSISKIIIKSIKYCEFFLLFILFYNFNKVFEFDIEQYIRAYVWGSLLLCFVNIFGYYIDNPIVSVKMPNESVGGIVQYQGRITVGQPALAIFPVLISVVWLMVFGNNIKHRVLMIVYLICIFLATSNTGIIALIAAMLTILLYGFYSSREKALHKTMRMIILFLLVVLVVIFRMGVGNWLNDIWDVYVNKIIRFISGAGDASMRLRQKHQASAFATMNSAIDWIFGKGIYGYTGLRGSAIIENTYLRTILEYGLIGFSVECLFLLRLLNYGVKSFIEKRGKYGLFHLCIIIIFMLHLYTLDLFLMYQMVFAFSLFVNYCHIKQTERSEVSQEVCCERNLSRRNR